MNKQFWEKLKFYKFVIVAHESSTGPPQELRDFLFSKKVKFIQFIAHPLIYLKEHYKDSSRYTLYKNGKVVKTHSAFHWRIPEVFLYVKDVLYTVLWCLQAKEPFDIYFGADPLNAFSGIFLRTLGKVKKVVYYNIDYTPRRFENNLLNSIYHLIDKICCYTADANWIGTHRTTQARVANGLSQEKIKNIIVVRDGTHSLRTDVKEIIINRNTLVYVGYILEKQGIDLVIDSLSEIKKEVPDIKFVVIGKGPYLPVLEEKVRKLKLGDIVEFRGFVKSDKEVQDIVKNCGIGVAPYVEDKNSFTYYSTSGKPVLYLGCGIPVIVTDVPDIARDIQKRKAGIMIHYKKDEFIKAVLTIVGKKEKYYEYKNNARAFGQELDWSDIFEKGMYETIKRFNSLEGV